MHTSAPNPTFERTDYSLFGIFKRFKWPIVGTFTLVVLENCLFIVQPYLIGKAVDDLLAQSFNDLIVYLAIMAVFLVLATLRRIYDTRTYASIRAQLAIETVHHQQGANSSLSEVSERTTLCEEILGFFEAGLFVVVKSVIEIGGALLMLCFIDWRLCVAALISMCFVNAIWLITRPAVRRLFTMRNDQREKKVTEIDSGDAKRVAGHFQKIAAIKISLSNYEAISFGAFQLIGLLVFAYTAYVVTGISGVTAGILYTSLNYVNSLNNAVIRLPNVFHSIVGVNEISRRLHIISTNENESIIQASDRATSPV